MKGLYMRTILITGLLLLSTNIFAQDIVKEKTYRELRELTAEMIESINHDEWSDYNVHDPGVTMMELVCYALTDLGVPRQKYPKSEKMCEIIRDMGRENIRLRSRN